MGFSNLQSTATPSPEEIQYCRDVMYINPDLAIEPLGFSLQSGMDDVIRFKFLAKTDDPSKIFDATHIDSAKFKSDFGVSALDPEAKNDWWDVSSQTLVGGNFTVPPPKSQGTRGLNIGFTENDNSTLTIYVLWHET